MDLDRFVNQQNLERFRRLASEATTEAERSKLLALLAEEETKSIELRKALAKARTKPSQPIRQEAWRDGALDPSLFEGSKNGVGISAFVGKEMTMAQFSDNLKSAISELSQDIAAEITKESRNDKRAIAEVTIDMLDVRYPDASKELNRLIADSSLEEVIAEAMEYLPTF